MMLVMPAFNLITFTPCLFMGNTMSAQLGQRPLNLHPGNAKDKVILST